MASSVCKASLLRNVARAYSAQAAPKVDKRAYDIETTTLSNKMFVASANPNSPIARVSITFKAGSRNESYDEQGSAHLLRVAAGLTTKNSSAFSIIRNLQEIGGSLSCTGDRETISYTVELTRDNLDTGLKYLSDVATAQTFKPWELADVTSRLKVDIGQMTGEVWAVELLHRAGFGAGLGNSIFCPAHQMGKISSESLQHFVNNNFTAGRASVSGIGVCHNTLSGFAQNLKLGGSEGAAAGKGQFRPGQEVRVDKAGNWASVAVAAEGGSWANAKEALAGEAFKYALGTGRSTKRGNINGIVGKAVSQALGASPFELSGLNALYSDTGLAGFVLTTDASNIGKAVDAAAKALKSVNVSQEDLVRAKSQLAVGYLSAVEQDAGLLEHMNQQGAMTKSVQKVSDIAAAIDSISASDVNAFAKKISSSKLSVGAIGNLRNVPYVEQL